MSIGGLQNILLFALMIKKASKAIKTYGWKNLSLRVWTLVKRKSGVSALFFRSHSYDSDSLHGQFIADLVQWPKVKTAPDLLEKLRQQQALRTTVKQAAEELKKGTYTFYSYHKVSIKQIDFSYNYLEEKAYPAGKHFGKYHQFQPAHGDLKNYWELNRLQYLQPLLSEALLLPEKQEENKALIFAHLKNWLEQNPHGKSLAWACGQETSVRCLNILSYLEHLGSPKETALKKGLANMLFLSALHVLHYIDYARSQRNNHAILEACFLLKAAHVFKRTKEAEDFLEKAKETLYECLSDQFMEDGHYIQNSLTYHRFAVQALCWVKKDLKEPQLTINLDEALKASRNYLYHFVSNPQTGAFPNYGPNDGTLLCNYGQADYRDLRPTLHLLSAALGKPCPVEGVHGYMDAVVAGYGNAPHFENLESSRSDSVFLPDSAWGILEQDAWRAYCRAADFRPTYPSQNDLLNVDLWQKGHNVLVDCGSKAYYSAAEDMEKFYLLQSGKGHNMLQVKGMDPMEKGPRFTYLDKAHAEVLETDLPNGLFKAQHSSFGQRLNTETRHERALYLSTEGLEVVDTIHPAEGYPIHAFWHLGGPIEELTPEGIVFRVADLRYLIQFAASVKHLEQIAEMNVAYYYHQELRLPLVQVLIEDYPPETTQPIEMRMQLSCYQG